MSDDAEAEATQNPAPPDDAPPAAAPAAAPSPPPPPPPSQGPWGGWRRPPGGFGPRGPLIVIVALLLGCMLGAGATAVGALVVGGIAGHHGPGMVRHERDDRFDRHDPRRGGPGFKRGGPPGAPAATPPATAKPAPSSS